MSVTRYGTPIHLENSSIQGFEVQAHCVVVDMRFALADLSTAGISFEKAASSVSVNASETSCGGVVTTAGLVSVRDA